MHKRPPYTSNTLQISFDFTGSSISLAAGTNITPNVTNFSMKYPAPPVDFGGFPLGSTSFTLTSLAIGTDAQGNIVTWDVVGDQFAFYPETPTGNQNAFSCEYKTAFAPTGGSGSLVADQDLGFCPFATISEAANGLWPVQQIAQPPATTPEPNSIALLILEFISLIVLPYWRKLLCRSIKNRSKETLGWASHSEHIATNEPWVDNRQLDFGHLSYPAR
jgi:hypothetical protein